MNLFRGAPPQKHQNHSGAFLFGRCNAQRCMANAPGNSAGLICACGMVIHKLHMPKCVNISAFNTYLSLSSMED